MACYRAIAATVLRTLLLTLISSGSLLGELCALCDWFPKRGSQPKFSITSAASVGADSTRKCESIFDSVSFDVGGRLTENNL